MEDWINIEYETSDEEEIKANKILKQPVYVYKPYQQIDIRIYCINILLLFIMYLKIYYPTILLEWL